MDNFFFAFIVLLAALFISRMLNERALKSLDQQKKAELIDLFSKGRIVNLGIVIAIVVVYLAVIRYQLAEWHIVTISYIVLLILFVAISTYTAWKKLKRNDFPDDYIKTYLLSGVVRLVGIAIFFVLLWF